VEFHFLSVRSIMRLFSNYGYLLFITLRRLFLIPHDYFQGASPKYFEQTYTRFLASSKKLKRKLREGQKIEAGFGEKSEPGHGLCSIVMNSQKQQTLLFLKFRALGISILGGRIYYFVRDDKKSVYGWMSSSRWLYTKPFQPVLWGWRNSF